MNAGSVLAVILLAVFAGNVQAADFSNLAFAERLQSQLLRPVIDDLPGAAIVAVVDGEVILFETYGVRTMGEAAKITDKTLFRLASLSKTIASATAAILIAEEPVSWETPVVDQLTELRFKRNDYGHQINLQHLMSQSTGLMPHAYTNLIEDNMPYARILKRLNRVEFICPPGQCYGYQNVVFSLIGDVVESATGVSYTNYVEDKLFRPLAMQRASFGLKAFTEDDNHAQPHVRYGNKWKPVRTTDHYYGVSPAAGVNASISDMKEWLLAQLGHKQDILGDDILTRLHTGAIRTSRQQAHYKKRKGLDNIQYGLGWRVFDYAGDAGFAHHGGYVRGMRSEMIVNRSLQMGLVFLTNSEQPDLSNLVFDFLDLYREHYPEQHVAATASSMAALPSTEQKDQQRLTR